MKGPLVTVALPARNAATTLGRAMRSILQQKDVDLELLVLNDGSTDRTADVAGGFEDKRVRVESLGGDGGLAACLNRAVAMARGRFFARMDADDVAFPERLRMQLERFESVPGLDLCGTGVLWVDSEMNPIGVLRVPPDHDGITARTWKPIPLFHPTWMGRTEWFRAHPYDVGYLRSQDQELLLRTYSSSRFANVADPLVAYDATGVEASRSSASRRAYAGLLLREAGRRRDPRPALAAALYAAASEPFIYRCLRKVARRRGFSGVDHDFAAKWQMVLRNCA